MLVIAKPKLLCIVVNYYSLNTTPVKVHSYSENFCIATNQVIFNGMERHNWSLYPALRMHGAGNYSLHAYTERPV